MIAGEVGRQDVMNPLVEQFGFSFLPGVLVQVKQDIQPDLMIVNATPEAGEMSYFFQDMLIGKRKRRS
ncbi:MAG: hypothetical protein V8R91_15170 [Butyricimonas faecihominis]